MSRPLLNRWPLRTERWHLLTTQLLPVLVFISALRTQGAGWWVDTKNDAAWTNKPFGEIQVQAQQGDALAQFFYARTCYFGNGRSRDLKEALVWTERAAERGLADAQYMASRFYLSGTATTRNPRVGFDWASRAALQNHPDALAVMGDTYGWGTGTEQDVSKAHEYFRRAIDAGSILALDWLGHFYLEAEGRTTQRTNFVEALRCFERASSNGMTHAATHLLDFYTKGLGTPPNSQRAVLWARYGADQKDPELMEKLAAMYAAGTAEPRDSSESACELLRRAAGMRAYWFETSAMSQQTRTLYALVGNLDELCTRYRFGLGTAKDFVAVAQWLLVRKRAEKWESQLRPGLTSTGIMRNYVFDRIVEGKLTPSSAEDRLLHEAVSLVHRALEGSDANACRQIGEMYRQGSALTPQSPLIAWVWLNRASVLKDSVAKAVLSEVEPSLSPEQIESARHRYLPMCDVPAR